MLRRTIAHLSAVVPPPTRRTTSSTGSHIPPPLTVTGAPLSTVVCDDAWDMQHQPSQAQYACSTSLSNQRHMLRSSQLTPRDLLRFFRERRGLYRGGPTTCFKLPNGEKFDATMREDGKYACISFAGREVMDGDYDAAGAASQAVELRHGLSKTVARLLVTSSLPASVENKVIALFVRTWKGLNPTSMTGSNEAFHLAFPRIIKALVEDGVTDESTLLQRASAEDGATTQRASAEDGATTTVSVSVVLDASAAHLPLRGLVFDVEQQQREEQPTPSKHSKLIETLKECGAVPYGTSVASTTHLPHPYFSGMDVTGSSGTSAFNVACGLSSFSCGAPNDAGNDSRIAAGLLGLSSMCVGSLQTPTNFDGIIARQPLDLALIGASANHWDMNKLYHQPEFDPRTRIMALKEFHGPCLIDSHGVVPGTTQNQGTLLHADVSRWMDAAAEKLSQSTCTMVNDRVAPISDISRPFFHHYVLNTHPGEQQSNPFAANPACFHKLICNKAAALRASSPTSPSKWDQAGLMDPASLQRLHEKSIDFVLSPLLRLSHLAQLPEEDSDIGKVLDPTFNPYCILAHSWKTPSVTIPVSITTTGPHGGKHMPLPYALVLTAVPPPNPTHRGVEDQDRIASLLHAAHRIHLALSEYRPRVPYVTEAWFGFNAVDDRVHSFPQWHHTLPDDSQ